MLFLCGESKNLTDFSMRGTNAWSRGTQILLRGEGTIGVFGDLCAALCKYVSNVVAGIRGQVLSPKRSARDRALVRRQFNHDSVCSLGVVGCHPRYISEACSLHSSEIVPMNLKHTGYANIHFEPWPKLGQQN